MCLDKSSRRIYISRPMVFNKNYFSVSKAYPYPSSPQSTPIPTIPVTFIIESTKPAPSFHSQSSSYFLTKQIPILTTNSSSTHSP